MNKLYTLLLALVPMMGFSQFEIEITKGDTFQYAYTEEEVSIKMKVKSPATGTDTFDLKWRLLTDFSTSSTTPNWQNYVCEGILCYSPQTRNKDFNKTLTPGEDVDIYTYIKAKQDTGTNTSYLAIFDPTDSANSVQIISLTVNATLDPAGISSLNNGQEVRLEQNWPNPFSDVTNINFEMKNGGELKIHDLTGKLVKNMIVPVGKRTIQVSGLQPGMYFYSLWSEGQVKATKRMMVIQ